MRTIAQIENWKELVNQAGLDVAKDLSKKLQAAYDKTPTETCHCLNWSEKFESVYIFMRCGFETNTNTSTIFFEYQGTAS